MAKLPAQDIVERLRKAMDGVTPGKWERFPVDRIIDAQGGRYGVQNQNGPLVADCGEATNTYSRANAVYIALCSPDNIGALLDTISRLTADNEAERAAMDVTQRRAIAAEARADALAQEVERLRGAWQALDSAISSSIKENDQPHRVFRDGKLVMEGEAAEIYHAHLMLLRRMARAALANEEAGR